MSVPPPEQLTCPAGHEFTVVRIGDAEPLCPACQVLPAYGRVLSRLAGAPFGEPEYVAALEELDSAMPGTTID